MNEVKFIVEILLLLGLIVIGSILGIQPPFFLVYENPDAEPIYKFIGALCVVFGFAGIIFLI